MGLFKKRLLRGLASVCAFFCAFLIGAETIAGSGDYKNLVDGFLGGNSASATSVDAYSFTSEYDNLTQMLSERQDIAEQIGEEGCVLLKNENSSLPLSTISDDSTLKITMLGSRAYTYKEDGVTLRDTSLTFYGGITGSKIVTQSVTTSDGTFSLPVTMETALRNQKIEINPQLKSFYSNKDFPALLSGSEGSGNQGGPYAVNEPFVSLSDCGNVSEYSDAVLVVIGRCSGEGRDYFPGSTGVKKDDPTTPADESQGQKSAIGLSTEERNLIDVANEISDNVIVLINSAITMEIEEVKNNPKVDSIMWIGLPGAYGLNGVAKVLRGKSSPSGHLSNAYAVDASISPAAQNFGVSAPNDSSKVFTWSNSSRTDSDDSHYVVLAEGIYTGYYYYETRYADTVTRSTESNASSSVGAVSGASSWNYSDEVSYTFGYGLSYTTFTQEIVDDSFIYDASSKTISVDVKVTNTGDYPAKDVVQLYVQLPYTDYDKLSKVEKSAIQLVTFDKTDVLYPISEADESAGKYNSQTLTLTFDMKYIATYDKTVSHDSVTGGYIFEQGDYYFAIGNGCHEALNNVLSEKGYDNLVLETPDSLNDKGVYKWTPDTDDGFSFDSNGVDSSYFSRSESEVIVKNQMADTDYNYFKSNTITYLSRSDWEGTFPKSYSGLEETPAMKKFLDSNVYEFTTSGSTDVEFGIDHEEDLDDNGNPMPNKSVAEYKLKAYDDPEWDYLLEQITFEEAWKFSPHGGSSCNPFVSVNAPEVWQIDGPNGNVTRAYGQLAPTGGYLAVESSDSNRNYLSCDMPCEPMVAATFNAELVEEQGEIYGEDNLWSRNPIMWAPGMNLHRCPFNSRNHEYYSEDPMLTNVLGTAFVKGGVRKGSILAAKHFAFNTQESYREGLCQFLEEQSARELELRAYQGLAEDINFINDAGNVVNALGLMSSFSRVGVCGVNAHTGLMKNILRIEWGFKGLISTDMVVGGEFFNPQDSVINNVTFMATSNAENLLSSYWKDYNDKNKVQSDPNMLNALYENMHYYMYSIANSIALNGLTADSVISTNVKSWWQNALIYSGIGFGVVALGIVGTLVFFDVKKLKSAPAKDGAKADVKDKEVITDAVDGSVIEGGKKDETV
ncbi:MAG: hypothetical protein E7369_01600 [Clostridiales bacterium]|nr:hypothetical protein [Clostridiales bacterium]